MGDHGGAPAVDGLAVAVIELAGAADRPAGGPDRDTDNADRPAGHLDRPGGDSGDSGDSGDDGPTLPVAAVARRLGVAPATLRTWDRRYGIGPREHTTGRHRRYAPADVARLELMQQVLLRGATPAEAASYALRADIEPPDEPTEEVHVLEPRAPAESRTPRPSPMREVGGRSASVLGLSRAAMAMDAVAAQRLIGACIAELGVVEVWTHVLRPVLSALANRWAQSGECVEIERMVHECTLAAVLAATPLVTTPCNPRPVLLCGAPDDRNGLPIYVLRAALAATGIGAQLLGADLPADALAAAVRRTGPSAVAVWAQQPRHGAGLFEHVPRTRLRARLFACGPGWFAADLPDRVDRLEDVDDAVHRIESLVGVAR